MTGPKPRARVLVWAAAWMAVAACGGTATRAPVYGPAGTGPDPGAFRVHDRIAVSREADASAVALALVTPGSAWELPGTEGLTHLAARAILVGIEPALAPLGAVAEVRCGRATFAFTLVAPPDRWEAALDVFMEGLLRPRVGGAALERARSSLSESLRLDGASPAWQARLAARQALYGDTTDFEPWASPPCGVWESLGRFSLAEVRAGTHRFDRERVTVALAGPVDADRAVERLRRWIAPEVPPIETRAPSRIRPGRRYVERNTVTAWATVAFPFGAGSDLEAIRLLGQLVESAVGPALERPSVFDAAYEMERHGAGGALVVRVATEPAAASEVAGRVVDWVASVSRAELPAAAVERAGRRFQGRRLLDLAVPEERMAEVALELALGRTPERAGWPPAAVPDPARVRAAAADLGEPAIAVVGPRSARPPGSP